MFLSRRRLITAPIYAAPMAMLGPADPLSAEASSKEITDFSTFRRFRPGASVYLPPVHFSGDLTIEVHGTEQEPITIAASIAYRTAFGGRLTIRGRHAVLEGVIFSGDGNLRLEGDGHSVRHCKFVSGRGRGLMVVGGIEHSIEHCSFENWLGTGISVSGRSHAAVIRRCLFDNRSIGDVRGAAVQLGLGDKDAYRDLAASVDECRFVGWSARKGFDKVVSIKSSGNLIRRSTFEDCAARLQVRYGARNRFEGCYLHGVKGLRVLDAHSQILGCYIRESLPGSSAERGLVVAAGNHPADSGNVKRRRTRKDGHPHAAHTMVVGCDVDHTNIGSHYRGHRLAALGTIVRAHTCQTPINLIAGHHRNTLIDTETDQTGIFARWAYLADGDVGPML